MPKYEINTDYFHDRKLAHKVYYFFSNYSVEEAFKKLLEIDDETIEKLKEEAYEMGLDDSYMLGYYE